MIQLIYINKGYLVNKSKRSIQNGLRKKMSKAIKDHQTEVISPEIQEYQDQATEKELLKKFPKRKTKTIAKIPQKAKVKKKVSKRTTPGTVASDSSPASPHREGLRWIKNMIKKTLSFRTIQAHHGKKK